MTDQFLDLDATISAARRRWLRLGISRRARRASGAALLLELNAAIAAGGTIEDVIGPDIRSFAESWAESRGDLANRQRYGYVGLLAFAGLVLGVSLVVGLLAAIRFGGTIAVDNSGYDVFGHINSNGNGLLAAYIACGTFAYLGSAQTVRWGLIATHDDAADATALWLLKFMPIAAAVAVAGAVGFASIVGYDARPPYVAVEVVIPATAVALAVLAARRFGLRNSLGLQAG